MEYPLRPPLFQLRLLSDSLKPSLPETRVGVLNASDATITKASGFEWYNELRTMEAEVMRLE